MTRKTLTLIAVIFPTISHAYCLSDLDCLDEQFCRTVEIIVEKNGDVKVGECMNREDKIPGKDLTIFDEHPDAEAYRQENGFATTERFKSAK